MVTSQFAGPPYYRTITSVSNADGTTTYTVTDAGGGSFVTVLPSGKSDQDALTILDGLAPAGWTSL